METIRARGKFHAAHRQLDYVGKCAWVHGHTWRGEISVTADAFPRDERTDMAVDFGTLKGIFRHLDHKMLVSARDDDFLRSEFFDPEGVVVMPGDNPSVENVALYCLDEAVDIFAKGFPALGVDYHLAVMIQETDNNFFTLERRVTI